MKIILLGRLFVCRINYSQNRRTISIRLIDSSTLQVTAPPGLSSKDLRQLISQKTAWIIKHAEQLQTDEQNPVNSTIQNGARIFYAGKPHLLQFHQDAESDQVQVKDSIIHLYFTRQAKIPPRILLRRFFIEAAGRSFQKLTIHWARVMQVTPLKIAIREQKTRWGSCSSTGTISYNWQVIMAPAEVMEYLVIHELSHLIEPNHSQQFWRIVKEFDADYVQHRLWLKNNGRLLKRLFEV